MADLAGSERVGKTGSSGETLDEAKKINASLSSLCLVIGALSESKPHVPYRNSKLTHVLQNALSGSAKTLMFVNINPGHHAESLSSLRFASKVGNVENGPAQANKEKAK